MKWDSDEDKKKGGKKKGKRAGGAAPSGHGQPLLRQQ